MPELRIDRRPTLESPRAPLDLARLSVYSPRGSISRETERRPMELERPLPQPITPEAKPYWDGLREHKLMLPRCRACGRAFFYPRVLCPYCHAQDVEWFQASGRGRLYSFEIAYQTISKAFKVKPPYVLAMIELEE